jgi:hypothetical protein
MWKGKKCRVKNMGKKREVEKAVDEYYSYI